MDSVLDIGFIGLGVMGSAMAAHFMAAGHRVSVFTRTKEKAKSLLDSGAAWKPSPAEVASGCQVTFTMVGYPSDVEEVYFGQGGIIAAARRGSVLVDATTSRPDLAVRIHQAALARGVDALDAPVSGGDIGARNATLTIMVGGDERVFGRVKPLFDLIGKSAVLQGGPGAGQHTKMANQIAIAGTLAGTVEAMTYARHAGLDPKKVLASIGGGAAGSWQLNNLGPKMLDGNFAPGFYAKHFLKDLRIALDAAASMSMRLPFLEKAESLFSLMSREGMDDSGTQALFTLYERGLA